MVKVGLQLKAFLENVTGVVAEGEDFRFGWKRGMRRNFLPDIYTRGECHKVQEKHLKTVFDQSIPLG